MFFLFVFFCQEEMAYLRRTRCIARRVEVLRRKPFDVGGGWEVGGASFASSQWVVVQWVGSPDSNKS